MKATPGNGRTSIVSTWIMCPQALEHGTPLLSESVRATLRSLPRRYMVVHRFPQRPPVFEMLENPAGHRLRYCDSPIRQQMHEFRFSPARMLLPDLLQGFGYLNGPGRCSDMFRPAGPIFQTPQITTAFITLSRLCRPLVTGDSQGLRHPVDISKPVTITRIVRLKNGVPYIEVPRKP